MKICLINNLYKPFNKGGAEIIAEIIAKQFHTNGHDVFIISTSPSIKSETNKKYCEIKYIDDIKSYYIKSSYYNLKKIPILIRLFWHIWDMFDFITANKIKKILNNEKPDLVITNNLKGVSYLLPSEISKLRIKHIHILHDIQLIYPSGILLYGKENNLNRLPARLYAFLCSYLFSYPSIVISSSKWLMQEHEKRNFFKISKKEIIRSPFNITAEQINKDIIDQINKNYIFLFIGQIEDYKGIMFLIKYFNEFNKLNKNTELHIIGDGSVFNKAKDYANNKIVFYGKIKSGEISDIMNSADCLIVPSLCYENSPTVIYEAIAAGLPVIASKLGGITELIHNYGGVLFEPGNGSELLTKMDWMIKNNLTIKKRYLYKYPLIKKENSSEYVKKIIRLS